MFVRTPFKCDTLVKGLVGVVIVFGVILLTITVHRFVDSKGIKLKPKPTTLKLLFVLSSFYPVTDPITPLGFIDKLSLLMGVHEQSAVVVMDIGEWN